MDIERNESINEMNFTQQSENVLPVSAAEDAGETTSNAESTDAVMPLIDSRQMIDIWYTHLLIEKLFRNQEKM